MIVMVDRLGRVVAVNQPAAQRLGRPASELIGLSPRELLPDAEVSGRWDRLDQVLRTAQPDRLEDSRKGRCFDITFHPILGADGALERVAVFATDITDHKRLEQERKSLLAQVQKDAQTKAALLVEVNHRVKNNLTAVIGLLYSELSYSRRTPEGPEQRVLVDLVHRIESLAAAHGLLSDAQWTSVRLDDLTTRIVHPSLQLVPRQTRVSLRVHPAEAWVDSRQANALALILNELATNTVKYAAVGREQVQVTVDITEGDGTLRLEYRDDGPGFPPAILSGAQATVGLELVRELVGDGLRGELALHNEAGAVITLRFKSVVRGRERKQP